MFDKSNNLTVHYYFPQLIGKPNSERKISFFLGLVILTVSAILVKGFVEGKQADAKSKIKIRQLNLVGGSYIF